MREELSAKPNSNILLYQTEDGQTRVEVRLQDETVWLSQKLMADLFQKDVRTINEHIKNILADREQASEATIRKFRIVQIEGKPKLLTKVRSSLFTSLWRIVKNEDLIFGVTNKAFDKKG